jgi:hypothetical protein
MFSWVGKTFLKHCFSLTLGDAMEGLVAALPTINIYHIGYVARLCGTLTSISCQHEAANQIYYVITLSFEVYQS